MPRRWRSSAWAWRRTLTATIFLPCSTNRTDPCDAPPTERRSQGMNFTPTSLPGVMLVAPRVFGDDRGFFFESFNARAFAAAGIDATFVQDNHSRSRRG